MALSACFRTSSDAFSINLVFLALISILLIYIGRIAPSTAWALITISNGKPLTFDVIGHMTAKPVRSL
jgi:hypothetical protein